METADRPVSEGRPIGIYIVVALLTSRAIQLAASLLPLGQSDLLQWLGTISAIPPYPVESAVGVAVRVVVVGLLIATVVAIVGMLRGQHWGWTMAVITTGFILAVDLGWWWSGEPRYLTMAASAVAVFYLNQRDVQLAFEDQSP
jgi:hypothetical protein